jgi:hypothetical protein
MEDLVELVDVIAPLEERLAAEQFGENASDGPYVDCEYMSALNALFLAAS